jgi:hypothetical protein
MKAAVVLGTLFLAVLFALTVSPIAAAEPMDKNFAYCRIPRQRPSAR